MPTALDTRYLPGILRDIDPRGKMFLVEHFAGGGIGSGIQALDVSPTGASTVAGVTGAGGHIQCMPTANPETKAAGLYGGDVLSWPVGWGIVFGCRFEVVTLPAAAGSEIFCGLGTAHDTTLNDVTEHLWFRAIANGDLLVQMDGNTAASDVSADTTLDLVAGQYCTVVIDTRRRSDILFYASVDAGDALTRCVPATQFDFPTTATGLFQFMVGVQATDAAQPRIDVDWIFCAADMYASDTQATVIPDYGSR